MSASFPSPRALAGVRVLDLSRILAGPTCTQLLGDLGAEVIKVERPGTGDDTRTWGPPFVQNPAGEETDLSAYYLCANRNKQSIAIDLATEAGADLIRRLVATADVVIENYKPGDLARRGLDYDALKTIKPDLIWCSISGFGQTGPYSDRIGYDFLVQAMGGIMSITGQPDAKGGEPVKVGVGIADVVCGLYATIGLLAALRHRDATGEGQMIDLALYDAQLSWLINAATNFLVSDRVPQRLGNRHPNIAPYQTFRVADGYIVVAVGNDEQFRRFVAELGLPDLADDPRFRRNRDRLLAVDALEAAVLPALAGDTVANWSDRLARCKVPAGPVASVAEALDNPHTKAREMVVSLDGPGDTGPVRLLGNPLKFSRTPVAYDRAPPHLDQDRLPVLAGLLGLSAEEIQDLTTRGAFGSGAPSEA
ncbi:CaiB/BaiF CoA transferase family protein [Elstera cyanobacteriorum]|uniref:CoA transferase n=1 Tax=Elstera cyanobacteriorum TaxID=2022747 RepID=A0A255XXM3_9PROT|nr:CaiB/BaiF CoA-transferase family protein [Elstera cyanobacteriorum]MCK6444330.1 CoA transferase [Elstera cyanobacteriorum]OYQ21777.1 CoA transferase [Elstera cyanobacteriorum]GGA00983.1 hypothetical protein GCM10011497_34570 [Elstera cyanobacteriorum]